MTILVVPGLPMEWRTLSVQPVYVRVNPHGRRHSAVWPVHILEFEHGWPWAFQRRAIGYADRTGDAWPVRPRFNQTSAARGGSYVISPPDEPIWDAPLGGAIVAGQHIAWTAPAAWQLGHGDAMEFSWPLLVADTLIAICLVVAATAGTEHWLRRRGAPWRWRLIDLAAVLTIVAVGLGYWKRATSLQERDSRIAPGAAFDQLIGRDGWRYRGPMWLARLVGGRAKLTDFNRLVSVESRQLALAPDGWQSVRELTALEGLGIAQNPPSPVDIDVLAALPTLRSLSWIDMKSSFLPQLPLLRQIERLELVDCDIPDDDVRRLRAEMPWAEIWLSD